MRTENQICPEHLLLDDFLSDKLTAEERRTAQEHLSDCPSCRSRLAERLHDERPIGTEEAPRDLKAQAREMVRPRLAWRGAWLPLAAAALLAVGVSLFLNPPLPTDQSDSDNLRSLPEIETVRLESPSPGQLTTDETPIFRWRPIERARRYDFELTNDIGDLIYEVTTTDASVELARANIEIEPGANYYWSVRAILSDGTVADSELRDVTF